ncbi:MAG: efflux RND transporter permease subunit [Bacteroidota bacterium]
MKNLIAYFIKYPITGNVLMVAILILGVLGLSSMTSTFFPENDATFISIQVVYPGASPEEVEEGVVNKIEDVLKGTTGIDRVTSVSSENTGRVTVEVNSAYNIDEVLRDVKNNVDGISAFPVGIESPIIYKQEALNVAFQFTVSGKVPLKKLKETAREIESDLLAMDGISKVELSGFPDEEIEIAVSENKLRAMNLTFEQVRLAVASQNIDLTGGTIKGDEGETLIRTRNKEYSAQGLQDIPVAQSPDGRKITLVEVATITDKWADNPNRAYVNGKPAVRINVSNTNKESLIDIAAKTNKYVEDFNAENEAMEATVIQDGSILLNQRIGLLTKNGVIGFTLVAVLLALFLRPSLAFWVAVAIPVSFAGVFLIGSMIGLQINVISLFGLILVLGILVDDGVVISENIYSHWERGKTPFQAAVDGTMEVLPAVFGAIMTTVIAFSTFFFLDGITGDFFADIAVVIALSLTFSLVEGAFILPGHISHSAALRNREPETSGPAKFFEGIQNTFNRLMDFMKEKLYAPLLRGTMKNPILGVVIPFAFLMISFGLPASGLMSITFFPVIEGDFATVNLRMPAGTPENITKVYMDQIENAAWELNEELKAERPDGEDVILIINQNQRPNSYTGDILIRMLDSEQRQEYPDHASSLGLLNRIEKKVGPMNEAELLTYQLGSPFGKPVNVALYSDNLDQLGEVVSVLKDSLAELPELINVESSDAEGLREINVQLKEKAKLLGLSLNTVVSQVRQGFFGSEIQRLQRGEDEVKVWVRYKEEDRKSQGQLENMYIRTGNGQQYPLKEIATLEPTRGLISINHLDGKREIRVQADAANAKVSTQDVLTRIQNSIIPNILENYEEVDVSFEGQARENSKFFGSLVVVGPVILFLMMLMIILTFRSVSQTVALLAIIPFSLIGVFIGHTLLGFAFSIILSGLGVLALIGILVNDGLVLISQYNLLIKNGMDMKEALYQASLSRFRPIFLTSVTTIAGLGPLILEKSLQAQFLIPMAITVAFGLAVATLLILVMLPALLLISNAIKTGLVKLYTGEDINRTTVEPAYEGEHSYAVLNLVRGLSVGLFLFLIALMVL